MCRWVDEKRRRVERWEEEVLYRNLGGGGGGVGLDGVIRAMRKIEVFRGKVFWLELKFLSCM